MWLKHSMLSSEVPLSLLIKCFRMLAIPKPVILKSKFVNADGRTEKAGSLDIRRVWQIACVSCSVTVISKWCSWKVCSSVFQTSTNVAIRFLSTGTLAICNSPSVIPQLHNCLLSASVSSAIHWYRGSEQSFGIFKVFAMLIRCKVEKCQRLTRAGITNMKVKPISGTVF
jgi:hypothetical protein